VYSFAAIAQGWRPRQAEKRVLQMATACGVCGTFKILGTGVPSDYLQGMFDTLYRAGYWAFIGVLLFSICVFLKNRKDFSTTKALFFFTFVLFFFRDPKRVPPSDPRLLVSAADGKVVDIGPAASDPTRNWAIRNCAGIN
jgi:hypothetical protein